MDFVTAFEGGFEIQLSVLTLDVVLQRRQREPFGGTFGPRVRPCLLAFIFSLFFFLWLFLSLY